MEAARKISKNGQKTCLVATYDLEQYPRNQMMDMEDFAPGHRGF